MFSRLVFLPYASVDSCVGKCVLLNYLMKGCPIPSLYDFHVPSGQSYWYIHQPKHPHRDTSSPSSAILYNCLCNMLTGYMLHTLGLRLNRDSFSLNHCTRTTKIKSVCTSLSHWNKVDACFTGYYSFCISCWDRHANGPEVNQMDQFL